MKYNSVESGVKHQLFNRLIEPFIKWLSFITVSYIWFIFIVLYISQVSRSLFIIRNAAKKQLIEITSGL